MSTPFLAYQKYEKSHSCQFRLSHIYCVSTQSLNASYATCTYLEIRCPQNLIDKAKSSDQFWNKNTDFANEIKYVLNNKYTPSNMFFFFEMNFSCLNIYKLINKKWIRIFKFTLMEFFVKPPWYSEDLAHASENLSIFGHSWPIRCLWWMSISRKSFKNCYFLCMCLSCGAQHLLLITIEPKSCWHFLFEKGQFLKDIHYFQHISCSNQQLKISVGRRLVCFHK